MKVSIAYRPNSRHQKRFHASKAYERLLMTGFGGGKTMAGAAEMVKLALMNPGFASLIVVMSHTVGVKTVIPTLKSILKNSNIKFRHTKQPSQEFYLIDFDHTIYVASADNPDSLKGANVTHVWFDELASMKEEAYTQGIARCRQVCPTGNFIFHTTTPEGLNWVYEEFFMTQKPGREIILGATSDNPALPETYIEGLKSRYTADQQEMYIHGRFVKSKEGLIIPEWDDSNIVETIDDPYYPYYERYVALDLGVTDKTVILFGTYHFVTSKLLIEGELVFQGKEMNTLLIADGIRDMEERLWKKVDNWDKKPFRFSDWNNPLLLQDLDYLHGIYVANAKKDTVEAMVNNARVFVQSGRLKVHPSCSELIGALNMAKWSNKIRPDFQRSKSFGHADAISALIIMIRNIDQHTNPIPPGVFNLFNQHRRDLNTIEVKYKILEDVFNAD